MEKTCCRCGETRPTSEFYVRTVASDGLNSACKPCMRAERRAYRQANAEVERAKFREWRAANRDRHLVMVRDWQARNGERIREYGRAYEIANAEAVAQRKHNWYEANREAIRERNATDPQRIASRALAAAQSAERNRDKRTEAQRRRRAKYVAGEVEIDLDSLWTGTCGICGQPLDADIQWPDPLSKSIDHISPLALGGLHEQANLQWAHLVCNVSKGARMPETKADG